MSRILIVEDNHFNRETLRGLLKRHFPLMIVEEASDGKEAMLSVEAFQPDLILMDIQLHDESGLELTKKIKRKNSDVRVLVLTGHHYPEFEETAFEFGADGFLVKGGSSKEIVAAVECFLTRTEKPTLT
jgi:DNA-binding NarL/FixJ family response regulator